MYCVVVIDTFISKLYDQINPSQFTKWRDKSCRLFPLTMPASSSQNSRHLFSFVLLHSCYNCKRQTICLGEKCTWCWHDSRKSEQTRQPSLSAMCTFHFTVQPQQQFVTKLLRFFMWLRASLQASIFCILKAHILSEASLEFPCLQGGFNASSLSGFTFPGFDLQIVYNIHALGKVLSRVSESISISLVIIYNSIGIFLHSSHNECVVLS